MDLEIKTCQNCKQNFTIEPEDFDFYRKVDVPPPTWCPECRLIRRLSWRNERSFYKRKCDLTGEDMISVYSPEKPYKAFSSKAWWSDNWDPLSYGIDYDPSSPFFVQLDNLIKRTPLLGLYTHAASLKNSEYTNMSLGLNNCYMVTNSDYDYDCTHFVSQSELCYESIQSGHQSSGIRFTLFGVMGCHNVEYGLFLANCSDCFGCVSLRDKRYCILNKQYPKDDYEKLRYEIIENMNKNPYKDSCGLEYKYGEFFPPELSPFGYNETSAAEFFPISKEDAERRGYRWYERKENVYKTTKNGNQLPDNINGVDSSIVKEVIACEKTGKAYKIIPAELEFYKRMRLPIPSVHPDIRHQERILIRNPFKLWSRRCQCAGQKSENGIYRNTVQHFHKEGHCSNEFETSYAPDRKEIVYCEQCYNAEVV